MKKMIIIGFMGSGKTTFGRMLAHEVQLPFFDLDTEIERKAGLEIAEIFSTFGESNFREVEKECFLQWKSDGVLACGGGLFDSQENRAHLQTLDSLKIWLHTDFDILYDRIKNSNRPLIKKLTKDELHQLWVKRNDIFASLADEIFINWSLESFPQIVVKIRDLLS
jgi:shikimate kinase